MKLSEFLMSFNGTLHIDNYQRTKWNLNKKNQNSLHCQNAKHFFFLCMDERHVFATTNNKKNVYHVTIILTYYLHRPVKHWLT